MAAAYAALVSLMNTVDAVQNHPRLSTSLDEYQTRSLKEKLDSLLQFVEDYDFRGGKTKEEVEDLRSQIGSAAHAAEVVIEGHIVDRIITEPSFDLLQMVRVSISLVHKFSFWYNERAIREEAENLKTHIESATHAADVMISVGAKESAQGSITQAVVIGAHIMDRYHIGFKQKSSDTEKHDSFLQFVDDYDFHAGITTEAVEDLKTRFASAAHAAEVVLQSLREDYLFNEDVFGFDFGPRHLFEETTSDLQSLNEDVFYFDFDFGLRDLFEETTYDVRKIIEDLDSLIIKVNYVYVKEQRKHKHYCDEEQLLDLQKMIVDMGSLMDKVNNVKEQMRHEDQTPTYSMPIVALSRSYSAAGKTRMVGFDGYMHQLKDRLTRDRSELQVIPITGMGGIGKTTLARNAYDDLLIVQHFDKRAWVTISQEYSVRKILVETLSSVGGSTGGLDENILGDELYKILFGRRYLIILDDMWSIDVWEKLHSFFPNEEQGSRIVVTTRQSDMVKYFGTFALILSFLDDDKSWQLFREKVFAYEDCPPELEGIGRKIVKKCGGLPLSIAVIGGFLGKSSRVQEYWENVEKDMSSIVNSADQNMCSDILSLSYNHLPIPLKPCFLYLGIFPEDAAIPLKQLVRLWVVEGFLKPNKDQSLEEVGEVYVKDLQDRNLIVVQLQSNIPFANSRRICKVHDLLRELCIRTAEKEKFFCVMSLNDTSRHIDREGLSVFHKIILRDQPSPYHFYQMLSFSIRGETQHQNRELWRVWLYYDYDDTKYAFEQVGMRYFEHFDWEHEIPLASILASVWNLQIICSGFDLLKYPPFEIWELTQLGHVKVVGIHLSDPPLGDNHDRIVLKNLHTLATVKNFKCSEEVCKRMPNLKKLGIEYTYDFFEAEVIGRSTLLNYISNVGRFNKLESLGYTFCDAPNRDELLQNLKFPNSLKKLGLRGCKLHWDDLTIIGSLPHLESLKLYEDAAQGPEWKPVENQFCRLKSLAVKSKDLITWNADSSHFPILEKLHLATFKLNEIPEDIGEIPTLRVIKMLYCGVSAAISALKILQLQEEYFGYSDIKVFVQDIQGIIVKVREWAELEGISTDNVHFFSVG